MAPFVIHMHGRLQEWVAEEHGFYRAGRSHRLRPRAERPWLRPARAGARRRRGSKYGAYESYEKGRDATVSCACHWTVNMAASAEHGTLWGEATRSARAASWCRPNPRSAGRRIWPASRSTWATIPAATTLRSRRSKRFCRPIEIALHFGGGPDERLANMIDRRAGGQRVRPAALRPRTARLPEDHRHDVHDGRYGRQRRRPRRRAAVLSRRCGARRPTSTCGISATRTTICNELPERFHAMVDVRASGPANASCSSRTAKPCTSRRTNGSNSVRCSTRPRSDTPRTSKRSCSRDRAGARPAARSRDIRRQALQRRLALRARWNGRRHGQVDRCAARPPRDRKRKRRCGCVPARL